MFMGHLYAPVGEVSVQVLCPFFKCIVGLPGVESYEFFIYLGDQTRVQYVIVNYVLPYRQFPCHFGDGFFSCAGAFYFDIVQFVYFFLYFPCPRSYIGKNIAAWDI